MASLKGVMGRESSSIDLSQSLSTFRLPPSLLEKLTRANFTTLRDVDGLTAVELAGGM